MKTLPAVLALLLAAAVARAGEEAEAKKSPLDEALAAFTAGEYATVVELAAKTEADDPEKARFDYLSGEAALALGRADDAATAFQAVLAKKPDAVPALVGLGRAKVLAGKPAEAIEPLAKAVKKAPKDAGALVAHAQALAATGKSSDAEKSFAKAWKLDKGDPLVARAFCEFLLGADRPEEAMTIAAGLTKAKADHPMGWFLVGMACDRSGDDEKAIAAYEKALEKDETFLDAHKNLGILCHAVNPTYADIPRTKKAFHHYERYFELGGQDETLKQIYHQIKGYLEANGYLK